MAKKPKKKAQTPAGPDPAPPRPHVPVVSIGCSAGGISALQGLFEELPADLGVAYVVISHLSPNFPSELSAILRRYTSMPVIEVLGETLIEKDKVYVIAPNRELVVTGESLATRPFEEERSNRAPIDLFFRSVGEQHGDGFAIVLSGGGSDGAVGLKTIKEGGGVILVQDPLDAEFGSMPRSAIATGLADVILPVRQLARRLAELARDKQRMHEIGSSNVENAVSAILGYLRSRTGHDFSRYKRSTVMRRLTRRMQLNRAAELTDYLVFLRENVEEVAALFADLLISVTTFFRDPDAFQMLSDNVVPAILESHEEPVRVWVPGCATGEEAYSIAIVLLEAAARKGLRPEIHIFATDLDNGVLATAREGRYSAAIEADVTEERLQRFFVRDGDHYKIKKEVRDLVVFANHSLLKDPPFSKLDLISCRNLLIYLERDLQNQVFAAFHYALKPGRYLFLGSAETVDSSPGQFRPVDREHRIYQSVERTTAPALPRLLLAPQLPILPATRPAARGGSQVEASVHLSALEAHAPPSALVDEEHRIVHLSEGAGRFLLPSGGQLAVTLTQLARPELRLDIRAGLHKAFERNEGTLSLPIAVQFNGHARRVLLHISPVAREENTRPLALVLFLEGGDVETPDKGAAAGVAGNNKLVEQIQQELQDTRERLKASREEYEATNEELRAANEELQSINEEYRSTAEELETSKEELQSMNEELQTVNSELKMKLEGVSRAHSDLQNLMAATEVGTLFLDTQLRIKRFTPRLADLFNITITDEGRPITDFTHHLNYDQLELDARKVLRDLAPEEREAQSKTGRWYQMRLRPYRTVEDKIDGVVVTFVDVTERRRTEEQLRHLTAELDHRVKNILTRVSVLIDRSQKAGSSSEELAATLKRRIQSMSDTHALLSGSRWSGASLKQICRNELAIYAQGDNVSVSGEDVVLSPHAAQSFSNVVHELTTNAAKYGALSRSGGKVSVGIGEEQARGRNMLVFTWRETGGPRVTAPVSRGFGLSVIEDVLRYEFEGETKVTFEPEGIICRIEVPLEKVAAAR
jgi:two-component system CheB/CheR fusion protein